ncbi:hypothetical protein [Pseudomonas aeruginosa]|uniref:hypothetical protein n=1 Tax=Pseudomonas aeruginosa TaxID=287 RepID=UPI0009AA1F3B|nr:hypothetical protein [Pseudomonas aeruginosa]KSO00508.2 hypothetical protein APA96_15360 [Pseudomonas aeruginosa]MDP5599819.1 hypothetical protein [Pseudomonas aeruginosa]MED8000161.1 hypothetical protein [Pseudomonas aeruginosa]
MAHLVYQPCTEKVARKNLQRTILNPVELDELKGLIPSDTYLDLASRNPDGKVYIWGVVPSKNTTPSFNRLSVDDVVIFNCQKIITVTARVTHTIPNNRALAIHLWGFKDQVKKTTWENIYFVTDVRHVSIPFRSIQEHVVNQQKMCFFRYSYEDSQAAFAVFDPLQDGLPDQVPSLEEARAEIRADLRVDGVTTAPTRGEHRFIVDRLFGKELEAACSICGGVFPRSMLVAAHIKKRSACELKEKLDIENIATPMCRLGCDPLYELGFISVRGGKVVAHPSKKGSELISAYVAALVDRKVPAWTKKTKKYFQWHATAHGFDVLSLNP